MPHTTPYTITDIWYWIPHAYRDVCLIPPFGCHIPILETPGHIIFYIVFFVLMVWLVMWECEKWLEE